MEDSTYCPSNQLFQWYLLSKLLDALVHSTLCELLKRLVALKFLLQRIFHFGWHCTIICHSCSSLPPPALTVVLKERQPFELKPGKLRWLMLASHCCWWRASAQAASLALLRRSPYSVCFQELPRGRKVQTPGVERQARAPGRSCPQTPQHPPWWGVTAIYYCSRIKIGHFRVSITKS